VLNHCARMRGSGCPKLWPYDPQEPGDKEVSPWHPLHSSQEVCMGLGAVEGSLD